MRPSRRARLAAVIAALGVASTAFAAGPYSLLATIQNPTPVAHEFFGYPLVASGARILVGTGDDDTAGADDAGAVYMFDGDPASPTVGTLIHTFTKPGAEEDDYLGYSIGTLGSNVLAGAKGDDTAGPDAGAVYLFDGDPMSPTFGAVLQTFVNPTPAAGDNFGGYGAIGIAGNVAVSDTADDTAGDNAGAVYLFDTTTGTLLHTFLPPPRGDDDFGYKIAAYGSQLIVAAPDSMPDRGAIYLFDADPASPTIGDILRTIVNPSTSLGTEEFGSVIAIDGDRLLVGAPFTGNDWVGAAYLFDVTTGTLLRTFTSPHPEPNGQFGFGVALVGGHALIGSNHESSAGPDSGSAYVFDADPASPTFGALVQTFVPESSMLAPAAGSRFGVAVAGAGGNLVVGAAFADAGAPGVGLVHVFTRCGDGVISAVEDCDDGNALDGDCCSSTCRFEPAASACDDGDADACTTGACTATGTCTPQGAVPQPGCRVPTQRGKAQLTVQNHVGEMPRVQWKWRGEATPSAAYGDPLTTTSYTLCVYDLSGAPQPLMRTSAPAGGTCPGGPCWRKRGDRFQYKDADRTPDGLQSLVLTPGDDGKAQIRLKGDGAHVIAPQLPFTTKVTAQLKASTGACWEAEYSTATRNTARDFKAASD